MPTPLKSKILSSLHYRIAPQYSGAYTSEFFECQYSVAFTTEYKVQMRVAQYFSSLHNRIHCRYTYRWLFTILSGLHNRKRLPSISLAFRTIISSLYNQNANYSTAFDQNTIISSLHNRLQHGHGGIPLAYPLFDAKMISCKYSVAFTTESRLIQNVIQQPLQPNSFRAFSQYLVAFDDCPLHCAQYSAAATTL